MDRLRREAAARGRDLDAAREAAADLRTRLTSAQLGAQAAADQAREDLARSQERLRAKQVIKTRSMHQ